ncbi:MAG: YihY/virulence factor BrkB family protein [Lentimicrobium sp.]
MKNHFLWNILFEDSWIGRRLDKLIELGFRIIRWSKKVVVPGFDGMPLYDVMTFFLKSLVKGNISAKASGIAYNFLAAIFPGIIMLFTIIPFIPIENFQIMLMGLLEDFLPNEIWRVVNKTVEDIITRPRGGLLSIGFIMALYFCSNGISGLTNAFDSSIHTFKTRSWFKQKAVNIFLILLYTILLIVAIGLISLGSLTFSFLNEHHIIGNIFTYYLLQIGRWIILIATVYFGISFLYYFAPDRRNKFKFFSAGGTLSTILILLTSWGFSFYIQNFSSYNAVYGGIGTILILMFYLWLNSMILLIGFELNASIRQARLKKGTTNK